MKPSYSLSTLDWTLTGYCPSGWSWGYSMETGAKILPEAGPLKAQVPGSVQGALLKAGLIPDWNMGMEARSCEWVENRSWLYSAVIPKTLLANAKSTSLLFEGLDGQGCILVNGKLAGSFENAFVPHRFEIGSLLKPGEDARLEIVFEPPPRWLGQICRTSAIKDWKPRFNYGWDWTGRLVQLGIWDDVKLETGAEASLGSLRCESSLKGGKGQVSIKAKIQGKAAKLRAIVSEKSSGKELSRVEAGAGSIEKGVIIDCIDVELWQPNGIGAQPLYKVEIELLGDDGSVIDSAARTIGFRSVEWRQCEGAPAGADPWLCAVNGKSVFLQGVNWTPVKPNFADVSGAERDRLLDAYKEMGCNILRVWGGAVLEKESFYDACDERGLMLWQEFPLSSSGIDNWPPEETSVIDGIVEIAESYIERRAHHASLILWCGGNELQGGLDGSKTGAGKPVDNSHPLIEALADAVKRLDPARRFLPSSSSGPRFCADENEYGKGLHWDVHGPWKLVGGSMEAHKRYWSGDDALFRSEAGCPGSSSAELIMKYAGKEASPFPASLENPLWSRTSWWFDWPEFEKETGRSPKSLEEYVEWSQSRQAEGLAFAARVCKDRFPKCGGFIVWMGHDSYPCTSNTSVIDFDGKPKPAALALKEVFLSKP